MILFKLFYTFFQIGLFTFGGGYAMISIVREKVLEAGWLTESELLNMIAVSESTPGPIAVNMATFVGANEAGILGSVAATLGVVLPSFIIILIISALIKNFLKFEGVQAFLHGVRPCVVGLIIATSLTIGLSTLIGFEKLGDGLSPDYRAFAILAVIIAIAFVLKKITKKKPSPILLIGISAVLGAIAYSF